MKKTIFTIISVMFVATFALSACALFESSSDKTQAALNNDKQSATIAAGEIVANQPAPTDLNYSLERYNLIKRAYWVNGQREKAMSLPCAADRPLGYITLFSDSGAVVHQFIVDGKVSSLGSYLFPSYESTDNDGRHVGEQTRDNDEDAVYQNEVPGIDGAYGSNVTGIFFFTPDGKYVEWTGQFLYSDIPFETEAPVLKVEEK